MLYEFSKQFESFVKACKSQWVCGGDRYALEENKEFTDLVCEIAGNIWIGGNIIKYSGEIWNSKRHGEPIVEVNFFKIAVYSYIWWLKEVKHPTTGIALKKKYWYEFVVGMWKAHCGLDKLGEIGTDTFIELIDWLKMLGPKKIEYWDILFTVGARAYEWWLLEQHNLTDRDKGEEFEK